MTRFSADQRAHAARGRGYLDREASLDFLETMDVLEVMSPVLVG